MIKIDFHIHTFSTIKDDGFEFDLQKLYQYVNEKELDVIAITNHNFFDKKQFDLISKEINAVVFPGMEVDIDNAHLLIICDNTDINKDNLEQASNILKKLICVI